MSSEETSILARSVEPTQPIQINEAIPRDGQALVIQTHITIVTKSIVTIQPCIIPSNNKPKIVISINKNSYTFAWVFSSSEKTHALFAWF
jgi:hypothetical protein